MDQTIEIVDWPVAPKDERNGAGPPGSTSADDVGGLPAMAPPQNPSGVDAGLAVAVAETDPDDIDAENGPPTKKSKYGEWRVSVNDDRNVDCKSSSH